MPGDKVGFVARLGEFYRSHPLIALGVTTIALIGTVRAVIAVIQLLAGGTGDEPPIRVKGGSIYLQMGALPYDATTTPPRGNKWTNDSGWTPANGRGRATDHFGVITFPTGSGTDCTSLEFLSNHEELTLTFTDTSVNPNKDYTMLFNVQDHGTPGAFSKRTTVDPGTLSLTPRTTDPRWLDLSTEGFLSKLEIKKNGTVQKTCTFTKDDDVEIVLFER